jgi:hypothetical protein
MPAFTLVLLCCVILSDFLVKTLALPPLLRFLPEAMSGIVVLYVLFAGTRDRFRLVAPKYWFAFGAMVVVIVCALVNNPTGAGPVLSGMRFHLRAAPLFFLAAVLPMSDNSVKRQLQWVLALGLVQVPVAFYQRWIIEQAGRFSGDDVRGTLMDSGILSLFLICIVLVLTGLLLKKRIRPRWYGVLFLLLLSPTTINETKVTVIFLPLGLMATLLLAGEPGKRLKYMGMGLVALLVAGALFIPIYNLTQAHNPYKTERDITSFFTDPKRMALYMNTGVGGLGTKKDVRRGDAIIVPFNYLAQDPVKLMFGLGIGAVSPSQLGTNFQGTYYLLFEKFVIISFTTFMLEFGLLGLMVIGALFWMVFSDTLTVLRRDDSPVGALAAGWSGVVVIFAIDVFYTNFHEFTSVTYLYCYFSGLICARCVALAHEGRRVPHPAAILKKGLAELALVDRKSGTVSR